MAANNYAVQSRYIPRSLQSQQQAGVYKVHLFFAARHQTMPSLFAVVVGLLSIKKPGFFFFVFELNEGGALCAQWPPLQKVGEEKAASAVFFLFFPLLFTSSSSERSRRKKKKSLQRK